MLPLRYSNVALVCGCADILLALSSGLFRAEKRRSRNWFRCWRKTGTLVCPYNAVPILSSGSAKASMRLDISVKQAQLALDNQPLEWKVAI